MSRKCALVFLLTLPLPLTAQVDRASINGTVTDASGALVPNAKVEVSSLNTGLRRETQTDTAGTYQLPALPVGSYNLTISKDGFRSVSFRKIVLTVGEARTMDASLELGAVSQEVQVTATAEALNRSSAEVSGLIESEQIRDMPSDGRDWASLMLLAPGAIDDGGSDQRSIRFNGSSRDDNNFTFDGVDASGVQEGPQKSDARLNISLEAIAEFRVNSSVYTAESGSSAGAQINVVSKTGTNNLHGGLFEFFRNEKLDTRSPFDPAQLPPFKMNQFGGTLGGPIRKNKTFFFVTYEGLRQRLGSTLIGYVPNAALRAQVAAASPALSSVLGAYPIGQVARNANTDQFSKPGINSAREDSGMFRLDHRFTDYTTIFVRYNTDSADKLSPNGALGSLNATKVSPSNLVLQLQHIFSPRVINETKFGMNRSAFTHRVLGLTSLDIAVSGVDTLPGNSLDEEIGTTFSYIDNLTVTRGRHTFKAGIDVRRIRLNNSGNAIDSGTISFSNINNFVQDVVNTVSLNAAEGIHGLRRTFAMGYVQDEWKATPQLTINLGLRYEYYSVSHEVLGRAVVVDVRGCGGICPAGTPWYSPNPHDLGPRVGVAWAPKALKGRTVIRSGFGIFYGANQNDDFSDPMESTAGRYSLSIADVPTLSYPITPFLGKMQNLGLSPKTIDRNRKDLYNENWNLTIQHMLPKDFVGQIGYVGSAGHHLFDRTFNNLLDPITRQRPLPQFNQLLFKENQGNNNFNALQASLQKRFTHGWLWQTQYMWSHSITDASVGAGEQVFFQNQSCRTCDRGDSNLGARHTITMNSIYRLPFGHGRRYVNSSGVLGKVVGNWNLSGLATARTGRPLNITVSRSAAVMLDGYTGNQRPDLVYGVSLYPAHQTINTWLDPTAFAVPAKYAWGNAGRFIARGPGFYEITTGLERQGNLTERTKLSFRAEMFNLLNHPIYANPATNISAPANFGRITSILNTGANGSGTPRRVQLMLRLEF